MAENDLPNAPFDTTKNFPTAPFAQAQARHDQQSTSVVQATHTIASDPKKVTPPTPPGASVGSGPARGGGNPVAAALAGNPNAAQLNTQGASALGRIGTATQAATMAANYGMREMAGDSGTNAQLKQIVTKGGLFGNMAEKLDALGQMLTFNSPGELDFWTHQPGVHDAIMNANPSTPGGAIAKLVLGMHADFARWKQGHPVLTAAETLGGGLLDPSAWFAGAVAGKIAGAVGGTAKIFGEAATVAAHNVSADFKALPPGTVAAGSRNATGTGFNMLAPKPQPAAVNPVARAGSAVGRTFPEQTKALGSAYTKLANTLHDDAPIIGDRFAAAAREYGPYGEWAHNKMINDHTNVPVTVATKMLSNDLFGGLGRDQKIGVVHAIEDLPNTLGGVKQIPPDRMIPVRGVTIQQRGENWSQMQMDFLRKFNELAPVTARLMMKPETYGELETGFQEPFMGPHNANAKVLGQPGGTMPDERYRAAPHFAPADAQTEVTPLQVSNFFPHPRPQEFEGARPGIGASGQQGQFGINIKQRSRGTLAEQMRSQPETDLTGRIIGRNPGMTLPEKWHPEVAATRKMTQVENYATMLQHVHDGRSVISTNTGKPAVMDVEYHWPGGREWFGGEALDYSGSRSFGSGPAGAARAEKFINEFAPIWSKKKQVRLADARGQLLNKLTADFQKQHPTHLVNAGQILRTPDIDGLAVEGTYLRMVGDANPVLKWLGTGQSVTARIPSEAGSFTHFQSMKAFPSGTVTGVNPSDFQKTHFSGLEDDVLPGRSASVMRAYDTFTSLVRMGKLFNFVYHPVFNVFPALTNLMLDHAGMNPAKIMAYTGKLDASLLGATTLSGREATATAQSLFKGGHLMGHEPVELGAKWDVPSEWMREAEKYGVTSKGSFGTGVPIDQYVHLFSSPWSELTLGEKAHRVIAAGSQWNQNLTFNTMEARMTATAFHTLVHDEKLAPEVAARIVNKAINDYSNLTEHERNPMVGRLYWFYSFKKMMMRQAATSLLKRANVLGTESRVVQNWNTQQGDPQAGDRAIVLGKNSDGSTHLMSTSMAPFRFGRDVSNLTGLGGGQAAGNALWSLGAGTLAPVPDAVARGMATAYRAKRGASQTPNAWDWTTGYADVKQPIDVQIRQALGLGWGEFAPVPYSATPTQYSGVQGKEYGRMAAAATNLRNVIRHMDPQGQREAMALVERLDNGDTSAIAAAKARYSRFESSRKGGF